MARFFMKIKPLPIQMALMFIILPFLSSCTHFFFQPLHPHFASPEQYEIKYEDIYFNGDSGKLHGWWFPAKPSASQPVKATVLFLHGNGQNISTHSGLIYWLTQYQYDVFIFDYRGYGKSEGSAQLEGALNDISRAREYVASRIKNSNKLFVVGHSLGASLGVVNLAMNAGVVDGIILVSPFSEYRKITRETMSRSWLTWAFQWPISLTINDDYNPIDYVTQLPDVPKLFMYSEEDTVIKPEHVLRLYNRANAPKSIERSWGNHNSLFAQKENQQIILRYLNEWSM